MDKHTGFVKDYGWLESWDGYKDHKSYKLYAFLIKHANWEPKAKLTVGIINRGEIIIGRRQLARDTGLTERNVRTRLEKMILSGDILTRSYGRFTVITLLKYEEIQAGENSVNINKTKEKLSSAQREKRPNKADNKRLNAKNVPIKTRKTSQSFSPENPLVSKDSEHFSKKNVPIKTKKTTTHNTIITKYSIAYDKSIALLPCYTSNFINTDSVTRSCGNDINVVYIPEKQVAEHNPAIDDFISEVKSMQARITGVSPLRKV